MSPRSGQETDVVARLLLVDADPAGAVALAADFAACLAAPPEVTEARCGRQASDTLRAESFDIVLMELGSLGDLAASPEEAVGRLVRLAQGALTIVVSDGASVSVAVAVLRAGAHDFVARPFGPAVLATRLAQLAKRHGKTYLLGPNAASSQMLADLAGASDRMQAIGELLGWRGDTQQLQSLLGRLLDSFEGSAGPAAGDWHGVPHEASTTSAPTGPVLPMWRQEQRIIEAAIASFSGNIALAAAALELSPSTIYRKRQAWAEMESQRGAA